MSVAAAVWRLDIRDESYPAQLRLTPDPPTHLWGIGDPALLEPGLAIIGSRSATPYGRACCSAFAGTAARAGVCVVSGAAAGCDSQAHRAALEAQGKTVAVLGCGPDVDYPAKERGLLSLVRERGCVVAEVPPGTPPRRYAFPRRNRIIAGLSSAVLVVEAGLPSGTFSTATHALDADREVLAVPGSVFAAGSAGTNRLLRDGATLIADPQDLFVALGRVGLVDAHHSSWPADSRRLVRDSAADPVLAAVLAGPVTAEQIVQSSGMEPRAVLARLGRLQTEGIAADYPGGSFGPALPGGVWDTSQRVERPQDGADLCPHPEPPWWEPA